MIDKRDLDGSSNVDQPNVQAAFTSNSIEIEEKPALQEELSQETATKVDEITALQEKDSQKKEMDVLLNDSINSYQKADEVIRRFDILFSSIEEAFPENKKIKEYAFPHPRNWLGPRFMAIWALPIVIIKRLIDIFASANPVRPYKELDYSINKTETVYTSAKQAFNGNKPIRFFGARFMTIWVLPLGITGILMEFLFVSPLKGSTPFG